VGSQSRTRATALSFSFHPRSFSHPQVYLLLRVTQRHSRVQPVVGGRFSVHSSTSRPVSRCGTQQTESAYGRAAYHCLQPVPCLANRFQHQTHEGSCIPGLLRSSKIMLKESYACMSHLIRVTVRHEYLHTSASVQQREAELLLTTTGCNLSLR
jgi:hypothetical protein